MPKQPGAQPVVGGQINPQMIEAIRLQNQYSQQRYLTAMETASRERVAGTQASATMGAARVGAASRERVAGIQFGTTKEIAAMQQSAEDERAAERIQMAEATNKLTADLRGLQIEADAKRDQNLHEYEIALVDKDTKARATAETAKRDRENNDEVTGAAWDLIKMATLADADRVRSQTAKGAAEAQKQRDQFDTAKNTNREFVGNIQQSMDMFIESSNWAQLGRVELPEVAGLKKRVQQWRGLAWNDRILTALGIDVGKLPEAKGSEILQRQIQDQIKASLAKKIGEFTNNKWMIWGNPLALRDYIESGRVQYADLWGGMAALTQIKKRIAEQIKDLDGAKAWESTGPDKSLIYALSQVNLSIEKTLSGIRNMESDTSKSKSARMARQARTLVEDLETTWLKEGIEDPEPPPLTGTLEYISELIDLYTPKKFGGDVTEQERARRMWELKRRGQAELLRLYKERAGRTEGGKQ